MAEFETPVFLQNHSPQEVHALMRRILPNDLDLSQGGHAYNFTMPTALVIAELCEFVLPEVVKLIFPETSYGSFVDGHAKCRGLTRRAAKPATGYITITGDPKSVIPAGSLFSTASVNGVPSVDYKTLESATIGEAGSVSVYVECAQAGIIGNTKEGTIVLVSSRLTGVKKVENEEPVTGGTEEESDESLIERIVEFNKSQGESYVGSVADYKRWATSVEGVGNATVIPAEDTSGTVTIIVTDTNGKPATEQLLTSVYNKIMNPDNPGERLAPINAKLEVKAPTAMHISVMATVKLAEGATIGAVTLAYVDQLALYLPEATDEGEVKYSRVAAILSAVEGVSDFSDLKIAGAVGGEVEFSTSNIPISSNVLPTIATQYLFLEASNA